MFTADGWPGIGRRRISAFLCLVAAGFVLAAFPASAAGRPPLVQDTAGASSGRTEPQGAVKGRVVDRMTQQPLKGVNVRLLEGRGEATTDERGDFAIRGLTVGPYTLEASLLHFRAAIKPDVIVRSGRTTEIRVEMDLSTAAEEVLVQASVFEGADDRHAGAEVFSAEEVRRSPGSLGDVNRILRGLPSVAKLGHQYNGLVVRGGSPVENAYYLDNIRVQNVNHFPVQGSSEGLLSLFNVDLIKDIEFHPGGFSAIYGDTLSSATDIRLREGNREGLDVQLDLNMGGAGGVLEGPLVRDRASWLLSFRTSFLDALRKIGVLDSVVPEYWDVQGKVAFDLTSRHSLKALFIHGSGNRSWTREEAVDNSDDFYGDISTAQTLAGIDWRILWGDKGYSDTSLSYSSHDLDYRFLQTSNLSPLFNKNAVERKVKVRNLNTIRFNSRHRTTFGFDAEILDSDYDDFYSAYHDLLGNTTPETAVQRSLNGHRVGVFIEHQWRPAPVLSLTAGLRASRFSFNRDLTISPSLRLSIPITTRTTLSASAGLYHQSLPEVLLAQDPVFAGLKDLRSVHYNLDLHHSFSEDTRLTVDLYLKEYRRFPLDSLQPQLFIIDEPAYRFFYFNHERLQSSGKAASYGLEILVQKKLVRNLYGLIGGSLYRSRYSDYFGHWWDRVTDNRYNATVDLGYKPGPRWEFSLRWTFVGGMPYTPFLEEASAAAGWGVFDTGRVNMSRLPDFSSLNLRFDRRFHFRGSSLILYISVSNVFDTRTPQMFLWNETSNSLTSQKPLGRIPLFGLELEF
jgi:hypothetical protein